MTCSHAKEMMATAWLDQTRQQELVGDEQPALRQHLETCAECSAEMAALGTLWERLGDLPVPEPSLALDARWQSTIDSLTAPRRVFRPFFSPRNLVWQAAFAVACLLVGVLVGMNVPRQNNEIAKLHEEIASTREMVALSLLQQQSATERLRGVDYTGRMQTMEPEVVAALTQAVAHDPSVNVRLAAINALSRTTGSPAVLQSLTESLTRQDSPIVQAALIDYLVDARDRRALGTLRQLESQPDLNPAVLERTRFAVQQLSR